LKTHCGQKLSHSVVVDSFDLRTTESTTFRPQQRVDVTAVTVPAHIRKLPVNSVEATRSALAHAAEDERQRLAREAEEAAERATRRQSEALAKAAADERKRDEAKVERDALVAQTARLVIQVDDDDDDNQFGEDIRTHASKGRGYRRRGNSTPGCASSSSGAFGVKLEAGRGATLAREASGKASRRAEIIRGD
jgi:hypothetical protein